MNNLQNLIKQFKEQKILVLGDAMLDVYLSGNASRISREAPVPIVAIQKEQHVPGGAANTTLNVATLGAQTCFLSVVGEDKEGQTLTELLKQAGIDTTTIVTDPTRETIAKKRLTAGSQQIVRFDLGSTHSVSTDTENQILEHLLDLYEEVDGIIISDYGYGVLTSRVRDVLAKLQKATPQIMVVDAKQPDLYTQLSPTLVKPNYQEAVSLLGITKPAPSGARAEQIISQQEVLFARTNAKAVAVTIDSEGALVFAKDGSIYRTYTTPVENSKAVGAGDTYVSAMTIALAAGASLEDAAELAAAATTIIVRKEGTAHCSSDELSLHFATSSKIVSNRDQLRKLVQQYRSEGKRIVFTNGCFDILHRGHVTYLNQAKQQGDVLILGINSDASVRRLKGPTRPINPLEDRMNVLAGLSSIDHLISFHEKTPINLLKIVKPDVFVKGGDYTRETLPETPIVEEFGGKVELIQFVENRSTTGIIKKIQGVTPLTKQLS